MKTLPGVKETRLLRAYNAARHFLRRPNVTGLAIGTALHGGEPGRRSLCIMVDAKIPDEKLRARSRFPKKILGVEVDVMVRSPRPLLSDKEIEGRRETIHAMLVPGIALNQAGGFGTAGLIVRKSSGSPLHLLTCAHVLPGALGARVYQTQAIRTTASSIGSVAAMFLDGDGDAALVRLTKAASNKPYGVAKALTGVREVKDDEILAMSGCMTGVTTAVVDYPGEFVVPYSGGKVTMTGFMLVPVAGNEEISVGGDSGAIWYDPATGEAVGMTVAGDPGGVTDAAEWTFACNLTTVLKRLKMNIA
jgi:hypothetical protein